ncbi:unnamed protein product, partial [marine sediment metagenome]
KKKHTIGSEYNSALAFDGLMGEKIRFIKGLLSAQEISQLFSHERIKYGV